MSADGSYYEFKCANTNNNKTSLTTNNFSDRIQLVDTVGKYALAETKSIISSCELVAGLFVGILQLANALDKKIIALIVQIDSRLRFTEATEYQCFYDDKEVKNIKAKDITNEILMANMN